MLYSNPMKTKKEEKAKNSFCQLEKHENRRKKQKKKIFFRFCKSVIWKAFASDPSYILFFFFSSYMDGCWDKHFTQKKVEANYLLKIETST